MVKILILLWIVSGVIGVWIAVELIRRDRCTTSCDMCKHLKRKGGGDLYRYYCSKRLCGFDRQPEYCSDWMPREDGEGDG